jgi:hypothetical protein
LADRTPEALVATAFPAVEFGGYFVLDECLFADMDGDGEEVEALMPFVWIPGGIGRLTLPGTVLAAVAEGAIFEALLSASQCSHARAMKPNGSNVMADFDLLCPFNATERYMKRCTGVPVWSKQE